MDLSKMTRKARKAVEREAWRAGMKYIQRWADESGRQGLPPTQAGTFGYVVWASRHKGSR